MYTLALRELIRIIVLEEARVREADIAGDRKVPWGSDENVSYLEKRCSDAEYWRNKHAKGSAKRSHYQTVLSHLKNELKSARKTNQALNEKEED